MSGDGLRDGICFCGGGTGGHVYPGLAVAAVCRARGLGPLWWIGDPQRLEAQAVPAAGIELVPAGLSRPRLRSPLWLLRAAWRAWRTWRALRRLRPRWVVALGGYAALLPGLLAPFAGVPVLVLEQNARPGRTNLLIARRARGVVTQFAEADRAFARQGVTALHRLGNPVRPIARRPRGGGKPTVLIMGGSLAATSINDCLVDLASGPHAVHWRDVNIVHLAGEADRERVAAAYAAGGIAAEVLGYCDDMVSLYERVDCAICRAGATTVAELCSAGIGAIYIPLPWAKDDHQTANASAVAAVGGARVLPQTELDPARLTEALAAMRSAPGGLAAVGAAAARLARPDAADRVVDLIAAQALPRRDGTRKRRARRRFRAAVQEAGA